MAVAIYGFTIVVPLVSIERGFPGGLLAWVEGRLNSIGTAVWFDDKLTATTYYDPEHAFEAQRSWINLGFTSHINDDEPDSGLLCAQVDETLGLQFSNCNWLEFDSDFPCAWIKGTTRGRVAVPEKLQLKLENWRKSR